METQYSLKHFKAALKKLMAGRQHHKLGEASPYNKEKRKKNLKEKERGHSNCPMHW